MELSPRIALLLGVSSLRAATAIVGQNAWKSDADSLEDGYLHVEEAAKNFDIVLDILNEISEKAAEKADRPSGRGRSRHRQPKPKVVLMNVPISIETARKVVKNYIGVTQSFEGKLLILISEVGAQEDDAWPGTWPGSQSGNSGGARSSGTSEQKAYAHAQPGGQEISTTPTTANDGYEPVVPEEEAQAALDLYLEMCQAQVDQDAQAGQDTGTSSDDNESVNGGQRKGHNGDEGVLPNELVVVPEGAVAFDDQHSESIPGMSEGQGDDEGVFWFDGCESSGKGQGEDGTDSGTDVDVGDETDSDDDIYNYPEDAAHLSTERIESFIARIWRCKIAPEGDAHKFKVGDIVVRCGCASCGDMFMLVSSLAAIFMHCSRVDSRATLSHLYEMVVEKTQQEEHLKIRGVPTHVHTSVQSILIQAGFYPTSEYQSGGTTRRDYMISESGKAEMDFVRAATLLAQVNALVQRTDDEALIRYEQKDLAWFVHCLLE